ncbi:MAG: cytochrome c oxidase subunit II [Armatimonadota bacterium]|nr:cytochrome c oxidase subunit II [Armatimonadota bacterium]MDR7438693.1 cytochrome c oxidase subunit II [Armatimonadota bacterium]MDR7563735.1 cytochrome c oxidase subunit II [Armatimonadota bacterium]MDR7567313.1 cytochrome c oxidase subunit II [Armatimonadota bacterium]MDR7602549.1 cytochrome c oxidase subunit II [Armatimonadota bacterium]
MGAGALVALWVVFGAVFLVVSFRFGAFPLSAAREAEIADHAFRLLMLLASPVFAAVVSVLVYVLVGRRGRGDPPEAPAYVSEHPAVPRVWFALTAALCAYVVYNPGLVGLAEMRGVPLGEVLARGRYAAVGLPELPPGGELVVRVRASRWLWQFEYPEQGVSSRELVLPVGRRVRFEVTSTDIVHSFWVPAFRSKIDAVPNLTTYLHVTPTRTGSFEESVDLRVQCAELCGVGHALMASPVRVVTPEAFEAWVTQQARR